MELTTREPTSLDPPFPFPRPAHNSPPQRFRLVWHHAEKVRPSGEVRLFILVDGAISIALVPLHQGVDIFPCRGLVCSRSRL